MGIANVEVETFDNRRRDSGDIATPPEPVGSNSGDEKVKKRTARSGDDTKPGESEPLNDGPRVQFFASFKPDDAIYAKVFQNMVRQTIESKLPQILAWVQTVIVLLVAFVLGFLIMRHLSFETINDEIIAQMEEPKPTPSA